MSDLILGLDVGSTSARALVIDLSGRIHGHSQTRLRSSHPAPGRVEQDRGEAVPGDRKQLAGRGTGPPVPRQLLEPQRVLPPPPPPVPPDPPPPP